MPKWFRRLIPLIGVAAFLLAGCVTDQPRRAQEGKVIVRGQMDAAAAGEIAQAAWATARDLTATLGIAPPEKPVDLYAFEWSFQRIAFLVARCPSQTFSRAACFTSGDDITIAMTRESDRGERLRLVRHETVHYVLDVYYVALPPWVQEGLARYFELGPPYGAVNPDALDRVIGEARKPRPGRLEELVRVPNGDGLSRKDYARAWALVACILRDLPDGPARMRRYLENVQPARDAVGEFEAAFGATPEDMLPAWRAAILRMAGEAQPR